MERRFGQIDVQRVDDVFCVKLKDTNIDEGGLNELGAEIASLIDQDGCRKMVLNLGPEEPMCLYSILLSKLVNIQRRLSTAGGALVLAHVGPNTRLIFQAAGLEKFFQFQPTQAEALATLAGT